ncbi:large subunit ribosomal protein L1 [Acholeplasma morum]|jgi:large subunit ribosomal protein L1|uniref:50S ribosomal protein L1 n=1 Tax=Paracholeplasma morum TaxID=264637 RepID=UPI00195ABFB5|nr:50S ribosomal protein L1 [Paracholeplasma morum]MBM7452884.1 large subunit ribosomal protein L1 [Paracholeplasma morum]
MKRGKKYVEAAKLVDKNVKYSTAEAFDLVAKTSTVKFDATVEIAFRLNIDPRKAEQNLRGAIVLPHGTGKTQRVVVIARGEKAKDAQAAGADHVGDSDLIQKIAGGWFDFDVMVATPDMMAELGKLGRVLGPKGLMPNPKTGTVTMDVTKAVHEIKNGKIEYRVDKVGNIQAPIGKVSFGVEKLTENAKAIYQTMNRLKPTTVKGVYMKNITVSSTMGPGIRLDEESLKA